MLAKFLFTSRMKLMFRRGSRIRGSVPLEVRSYQRWGELEFQSIRGSVQGGSFHQRFGPIKGLVPLYMQVLSHQRFRHQRFRHQRFTPVGGSKIRGLVPLEVWELEVRALEVESHQMLENQRFSPIRGSGIIGWGISDSVGEPENTPRQIRFINWALHEIQHEKSS